MNSQEETPVNTNVFQARAFKYEQKRTVFGMATGMIYRDRNMKEASEGKYRVHTLWQEEIIFLKLVK